MKDVRDYPNLFARLLEKGWKESDLVKIAGGNIIRVLADVEKVKIYLIFLFEKLLTHSINYILLKSMQIR